MADFDRPIAAAKAHHIHIIMDMVMNHTSDQSPRFKESRSSRNKRSRRAKHYGEHVGFQRPLLRAQDPGRGPSVLVAMNFIGQPHTLSYDLAPPGYSGPSRDGAAGRPRDEKSRRSGPRHATLRSQFLSETFSSLPGCSRSPSHRRRRVRMCRESVPHSAADTPRAGHDDELND